MKKRLYTGWDFSKRKRRKKSGTNVKRQGGHEKKNKRRCPRGGDLEEAGGQGLIVQSFSKKGNQEALIPCRRMDEQQATLRLDKQKPMAQKRNSQVKFGKSVGLQKTRGNQRIRVFNRVFKRNLAAPQRRRSAFEHHKRASYIRKRGN